MSMPLRVVFVLASLVGESSAGGVAGRLELPKAPERPPSASRGFLERVENPLAPVRRPDLGKQLAVVLDGDAAPQAPGQIVWELAGESFGKPLLVVPVGAEVLIRNTSNLARTVAATEDGKLIPQGAIEPGATKSFRVTEAKSYTIVSSDAAHLRAKLLVVATPHFAHVDVAGNGAAGTFQLADVPDGTYKVRVFYKDGWLDHPEASVTVSAKAPGAVTVKIPAGFPLKK